MSRLKVVYLDHCARLSGGEIALLRLLPPLLPEVEPLVLLGEDGPLVERLQDAGIAVEVLALAPRARDLRKDTVGTSGFDVQGAAAVLPYTWRLARRLRRERPDLVHTNSLKAAMYGGVASRLAGVPMVWHLRDRIATDYLPRPAVALVRAAAAVLPSVVVANSASTLSTVSGRGRGRGTVIDNAIIHDSVDDLAFRLQRSGPFTVGVVGRLAPWKGQHVFLQAFAQAFAGSDVRARLIGSAMFGEQAYEQQLHQMVESLGIVEQVEFRGFRNDVWAELNDLDLLVHCSTSPEPFGQVVVEGMAAGLPVIASAEGGPAEIITHGVDGLLVAPREPTTLALQMTSVMRDDRLRARLAAGGQLTSSRYTPEATAAQVLRVYRSVSRG